MSSGRAGPTPAACDRIRLRCRVWVSAGRDAGLGEFSEPGIDPIVVLFLSVAVCTCLLILIFVVFKVISVNTKVVNSEEINLRVEAFISGANDALGRFAEKQAQESIRLTQLMADDRAKQLSTLGELRVELEKRFAESSLSLNQNIHQFKAELLSKFELLQKSSSQSIQDGQLKISYSLNEFTEKLTQTINESQKQNVSSIAENIRKGIQDLRLDLDRNSTKQTELLSESMNKLSESTDSRLKDISGQVDKRLNEGFEKTTKTFTDVLKRLALIDEAQKKITELSSNVVGLQEILNDKRSRGAFGEVQLQSLVQNVMPETHYSMQYQFSNDKIADCVLELPEPTGKIAIDAKFPLESYRKMTDLSLAEADRKDAARQFSRDIKKHISDISDKYILPAETSDGAVMFIPAESVFAEIHGHYPELVELAYQRKVWMVSPTTLMAILTTASAVIKDEQTRKQVHIIKEHLSVLGKDFGRFESRMNNLAKHIGMVTKDVEMVHTSARKISSRFDKIEKVELNHEELDTAAESPQVEFSSKARIEEIAE